MTVTINMKVQNLTQQDIHFIGNNNVPSSDNNLLIIIHLTMSLWTVKMAKMVMEIAYKYQFQTMSKIQKMKKILKWDGNGYCIRTLG